MESGKLVLNDKRKYKHLFLFVSRLKAMKIYIIENEILKTKELLRNFTEVPYEVYNIQFKFDLFI